MACAIPELIFDKQEPMPKLKRFTGYTGYTGNEKTIKTLKFASKSSVNPEKVLYTPEFDFIGKPIEYTNSSDKPYHYPSKEVGSTFGSNSNDYIGWSGYTGPDSYIGLTGFTSYDRPSVIKLNGYTGFTGSSECDRSLKDAVKIIDTMLPKIGYTGYTGSNDTFHKELINALRPITGFTESDNGFAKIDNYFSKDSVKVLKATPEKPKHSLWQALQIMLFEYICSINNRYDLNIPLDIVG